MSHTKLDDGLAKVQRDVDSWANTQTRSLEEIISQHNGVIAKQQDTIHQLTLDEQKFKQESEQLKLTMLREQTELEKIRYDIEALHNQEQSLPNLLEEEKARFQVATITTAQKNQEVAHKERELNALLKETTLGAEYYKDRLGLDFERIEDSSLRFCFSKVDPSNPNRKFIFSILVDGNELYRVVECTPKVDDLVTLVAKLNATNNFSWFVQAMRKQFQAKTNNSK